MKVPTQSELVALSKNEEIIIGVGPRFFQSVIFSTLTILLCTTQKRDCMTLIPSSEIRRVVAMQEEPPHFLENKVFERALLWYYNK